MDRTPTGVDTTQVRRWNRQAVLRTLRGRPERALTAIARELGLSRQTTLVALEDLRAAGLVVEHAPTTGGAGRPAKRYGFRATAGHAVGISIAPDHALVLACDLDGTVVATAREEMDHALPAAERLHRVRDLARRATADLAPVWAACAATSGIVDEHGRVRRANQIPGWTGLDLAGTVGGWFDCSGRAGNDGALAVLGEQWRGNAGFAEDVVLILTGHRLGMGLMLDGRVHIGRTGAAGELGRLLADQRWDPTAVFIRAGREPAEVFAAARAGDDTALALVQDVAERTARSAAVMVSVLDPELLVIAGAFTAGGDQLLDPVRHHLGEMCTTVPEVVFSSLGGEITALGAARSALEAIEQGPHLYGDEPA